MRPTSSTSMPDRSTRSAIFPSVSRLALVGSGAGGPCRRASANSVTGAPPAAVAADRVGLDRHLLRFLDQVLELGVGPAGVLVEGGGECFTLSGGEGLEEFSDAACHAADAGGSCGGAGDGPGAD